MVVFISSALFALSASLDAFLTGAAFGLRRIRIPLRHNLTVSLITLIGTVLSIWLGQLLAPLLPGQTASVAGSLLLILMGAYYLIKFMLHTIKKYHFRVMEDKTSPNVPVQSSSLRSVLALGAALSLNNIGIGITASIAGLALLPSAALTLLFSVLLLALGNRLGQAKIFRHIQHFAEPITGLMLILLGVI